MTTLHRLSDEPNYREDIPSSINHLRRELIFEQTGNFCKLTKDSLVLVVSKLRTIIEDAKWNFYFPVIRGSIAATRGLLSRDDSCGPLLAILAILANIYAVLKAINYAMVDPDFYIRFPLSDVAMVEPTVSEIRLLIDAELESSKSGFTREQMRAVATRCIRFELSEDVKIPVTI